VGEEELQGVGEVGAEDVFPGAVEVGARGGHGGMARTDALYCRR
jgi:hypothetical protein